jgi:hypothetical protein
MANTSSREGVRLSSDSPGRIEVARVHATRPARLPPSWLAALLDLCPGTGFALPAACGRAGGRKQHTWSVGVGGWSLRERSGRFANGVAIGFGEAVMGGAR